MWRPRSIFQLLLFGLFAVVAPLCLGIFYTIQTLDKLTQQNYQVIEKTIAITRSSQLFQSNLLDLERRARQYVALGDADLLDLFVHEHQQLLITLTQIDFTLSDIGDEKGRTMRSAGRELYSYLESMSTDSGDIGDALELFGDLTAGSSNFQKLAKAYVDEQLVQLNQSASEIQHSLVLMAAVLAVLTLGFSLLFIYWINTPIKQIGRKIKQLGSGDLSRKITISGPTEMQTLGVQLEWLRSHLNELELQKSQFLRHMSHELKTPLASLREGADLMADGVAGELKSKQKEVVNIIQHNSHELQRLIENLLDFNQVLHSQKLTIRTIHLRTLWHDLLADYQMTIARKSLNITCEGVVEGWPVDEAKFRAVLDNLLSNAVNYTPENGQIDIHWWTEQGLLTMDVANSGPGIQKQDAEKIFEPFYQGSNSRTGPIKGSGIGLSVARECMLAHGGILTLVKHRHLAVCFRLMCPANEKTVV